MPGLNAFNLQKVKKGPISKSAGVDQVKPLLSALVLRIVSLARATARPFLRTGQRLAAEQSSKTFNAESKRYAWIWLPSSPQSVPQPKAFLVPSSGHCLGTGGCF